MPFLPMSDAAGRTFLEGVPLWVYGSSFTVSPGLACTSGMEFYKLVQARLKMGTATTFGINGKTIREAAKRIVGGVGVAGAPWIPTRKGVAVIDTWVNDLAGYQIVGGDYTPRAFVAKDISGIKANLAAALAYISAGTIIENTAGTKAGTWAADGSATDRSGGNNSTTSDVGATMTFTGVSVPEDHFFFLSNTLEPASFALSDVEVLVDGVVARTIASAEFECHSLIEGGTVLTGNAAFRIPCTPGTHTIVIRQAGSAGQNMLVDAIIVPKALAARSPILVIQDQLPRGVVGGTYWHPDDIATLAANKPLLDAAYAAVLADFPNAHLVLTTLDATQDYGPDGLHPNDRGMIRKADELTLAIRRATLGRQDSLYALL